MRASIKREKRGDYARLVGGVSGLSKHFWDIAGAAVEGGIIDNILTQRKASGGMLKKNKRSTMARKMNEGKPPLSLVDELHRFIQGKQGSWKILRYLPAPSGGQRAPGYRGIVIGPANGELSKLIQYVGKLGYVGYIGISAKAASALKALLRMELRRMFTASRGR